MNLDRAIEYARATTAPKAAASLFYDIEMEVTFGFYSEEQSEEAEEALRILRERFPDIEARAGEVTSSPNLSRDAKARMDAGDEEEPEDEDEWEEDDGEWDEEDGPSVRAGQYGRALASIVLIVLIGLTVRAFTPTNHGCPSGSSWASTTMTSLCDRPDGSVACVQSAFGFTPLPSHQSAALTYTARISTLGPWCSNATDPPVGDGG